MLLLFDIDATLITTQRAGVLAMRDAGRELIGDHFSEEGHSFAGSLDPVIITDMLRAHGAGTDAASIRRFREVYAGHLARRLSANNTARALPGVLDVLAAVRTAAERRTASDTGPVLGLLTGNFPETGALKLRHAGIDPEQFEVAVWGDDSPLHPPRREHLPPVAVRRWRERFSPDADASIEVTIIGDTPHDVCCGLAHGCRVLGVGTGQFSARELLDAGAHHALDSLADTHAVIRWLLRG